MRLIAAGDRAVLARTGARLSPGAYRRALRLWRALRTAHVPGVMDLVLAYASVLVHFDPLVTNGAALAEQIRAVAATEKRDRMAPGRLVTLPVRYGGANGPDLAAVAAHVGLTPDEVVRLHAHPLYRVYFLGFTAGFPYLAGLPPALASPRLNAPRTRVPAGSVGIAGQQTGVYPAATPGGWRLIGRTSACLFDPSRDPPALLHPGDRVRFRPIAGTAETASADQEHTTGDAAFLEGIAPGVPWLRVIQPGPLTTVQDLGRPGYAAEGVAAGGAVDRDALRLGNLLLGNPPGAAALEITLGAATFEALAPCAVAVTGADCALRVAGQPIPRQSVALVPAGARIEVDRWRWGARAYLCVEGGVAVPLVLGSRSTDLRAGMGGLAGRALRPGDEMRRAATTSDMDTLAGRRVPDDPPRDEQAAESAPGAPGATILRMLPGPHSAAFPGDLAALLASSYRVDVRADRMGARLVWDGPSASDATLGGDVLSEGVPDGAIQLPPDGQPILLLADHQTTGGYRVPAVVVSADQARAAQLRPGDAVRFALTTPHQALAALHARADWFTATTSRLGWATQDDRVTIELLMGGFAEWSEETSDDE